MTKKYNGKEKVTVREVAIDLFRSFNMTKIFGNPGSTELPMFRDFPDDFEYILALQESIAIGMADGYAQATRNASLVNLHSAVGVGHAAGNIFTAFKNQTPMVITAGQQARSILPYEPFLFAAEATEFPKPYVKWSCEPARAEDVPAALARAYYISMQAPQGPTFVSIPIDDWDRECEQLDVRTVSTTIQGDSKLLNDVSNALNKAKNPVIVVGAGVSREDAWDEIISLAEQHKTKVWASPMSSRNSFPEDHPLFAGFLAANKADIIRNTTGHDLILVLGAPAFSYHVEDSGPHIPEGAELFQIVDSPNIASWTPVGTAVVSSLKSSIQHLLDHSNQSQRHQPAVKPTLPLVEPTSPLTDKYLLQQLAKIRHSDSIIVEEAPSSRGPMHDYLPIIARDTFYTCASGGLGHGLPAAIGIALGRPKDKVICVLGDGSSMYSIQGLWTAARLKLPITFIVINNSRYEALHHFGALFELKEIVGTDLSEIDFCDLGKSLGCTTKRVDEAKHLDDALEIALNTSDTYLLEVIVK